MVETNEALQFWGKTFTDPTTDQHPSVAYKPVLHHLIDVAAVAQRFLELHEARTMREARRFAIAPQTYPALMAFFAGLHDLGKFSRNFQAKRPDLWPACLGPMPAGGVTGPHHTAVTAQLLSIGEAREVLKPHLPSNGTFCLVAAIAGHHGCPPSEEDPEHSALVARTLRSHLDETCCRAAVFSIGELLTLTALDSSAILDTDHAHALSWSLSGLITLADWVGSDTDYFGPDPLDSPLQTYWTMAKDRATAALRAKGLVPLHVTRSPRFATIAPPTATPRPTQRLAETMALPHEPSLIVIEDLTGSGKTETAIVLAMRLMAQRCGEGIYFGLPTMATANAMHGRFEASLAPAPAQTKTDRGARLIDRMFADTADHTPSLILSHGKAALSRALDAIAARCSDDGEPSTAASCNEWIADDRRRAFFADVGVGTIDQAFLTVLPKKFLTLRQYALAGRILIVDEAHCFDAYMEEELRTLLRLHASNGGSAIILSATLAKRLRHRLVEAFLVGRGLKPSIALERAATCSATHYPLVTMATASGIQEIAPDVDQRLLRTIAVERLADRVAACDAACAAADRGAAVLVICNAVDEAIKTYQTITARRPADKASLFHARFAHGDRLAIERDVLRQFGRDSTPALRAGRILVATQVAEQSLDIDADLVVSDLAPIDLLIQRAGRLWRHMDRRPAQTRPLDEPKLMVVAPDPRQVESENWLNDCLGSGAFVYHHGGVMWRSASVIFEFGKIRVPSDLRPLIETVYGDARPPVPAALAAADRNGDGLAYGDKALGQHNVIDIAAGYAGIGPKLSIDEHAGTRLGEETITLRLAQRQNGRLVPWCAIEDGMTMPIAWALSEIRIRKGWWQNCTHPEADNDLHEAAKRAWTEWEQDIALAEVDDRGALRIEGPTSFRYSKLMGLQRLTPTS